jgi:hypothetical protein
MPRRFAREGRARHPRGAGRVSRRAPGESSRDTSPRRTRVRSREDASQRRWRCRSLVGAKRSDAKARASRANGRLGGALRKTERLGRRDRANASPRRHPHRPARRAAPSARLAPHEPADRKVRVGTRFEDACARGADVESLARECLVIDYLNDSSSSSVGTLRFRPRIPGPVEEVPPQIHSVPSVRTAMER